MSLDVLCCLFQSLKCDQLPTTCDRIDKVSRLLTYLFRFRYIHIKQLCVHVLSTMSSHCDLSQSQWPVSWVMSLCGIHHSPSDLCLGNEFVCDKHVVLLVCSVDVQRDVPQASGTRRTRHSDWPAPSRPRRRRRGNCFTPVLCSRCCVWQFVLFYSVWLRWTTSPAVSYTHLTLPTILRV